jgi:hypothetical protein
MLSGLKATATVFLTLRQVSSSLVEKKLLMP